MSIALLRFASEPRSLATEIAGVHHCQSPALAAGRSERGVGVGIEGIDAVLVEVGGVDQADLSGRVAVLEHC